MGKCSSTVRLLVIVNRRIVNRYILQNFGIEKYKQQGIIRIDI